MRRIVIVILCALFFFSVGFVISYLGNPFWGREAELNQQESGGINEVPLVADKEEENVLSQEWDEPIQPVMPVAPVQPEITQEATPPDVSKTSPAMASADKSKEERPVVQAEAIPTPRSYEEEIEARVRASMAEALQFSWDESQRYIGILDNHIAIFQGVPGVGGMLIEETDISTTYLPEFEIRNLRKGIAFRTEEEKYRILESLSER